MIEGLEKMLVKGVDNVLLCFGLGKGYLDVGDVECVVEYFQCCVEQDLKYFVGWKLLGKVCQVVGDFVGVWQVWEQGLVIVVMYGDKQVEKEMMVFLCKFDRVRI